MKFIYIFLLIIFIGCATPPPPTNTPRVLEGCSYESLSGREFVFREIIPEPDRFSGWHPNPKYYPPLLYSDYVKMKGKFQEPITAGYRKWYPAIMENCEVIYSSDRSSIRDNVYYYVDELEDFKSHIGEKFWFIEDRLWRGHSYTLDDILTDPIEHLEELKIVDLDTTYYQAIKYTYIDNSPFFLIVENNSGESKIMPYLERNISETNPIDPSWDAETIKLIKQKKIQLGMTTEQAKVAWGKPEKVNRSVGLWGVHEQWIYGNTYVYFDDGILTSWQD